MMTWLYGESFTLVSPHSPEHCADRLNTAIVNPFSWFGLTTLLSVKPLLGEASRSHIRIRKLNQFNNALQPELTATLEPCGAGTRLHCRIGLTTISLILFPLITAAFFSLGAYGVIAALVDLSEGRVNAKKALAILPSAFLVISILHGRYLARGEKEYLEQIVTERLDARRE